ncbi:sulfatase [Verrucomicrobiota bacterium]|nr:sulfatase [Verrucomicrobiota bacterium]
MKNFPAHCPGVSRRSFLADTGMGFTGLALGALLFKDGVARAATDPHAPAWQPPDGRPHTTPKAKSVIWIFLCGGVSHMESFDVKPELNKYAGKSITDTPYKSVVETENKNVIGGNPSHGNRKIIFPLQTGYQTYGQSGLVVGDWFKHIGTCADDLAVVRSLWTVHNDHGAQLTFQTGRHPREGAHPTIGSWATYGLGTMNENLPSFIVLGTPTGDCCGGTWTFGSSYLGPQYAGVRLNVDAKKPLPFIAPANGARTLEEQQANLSLLGKLNQASGIDYPDDQDLRARIKSYELAFQMQTAVPELMQLDRESDATRKLYGLDASNTKPFGELCLAARRMVEKGVRFIQIFHGGGGGGAWDAHSGIKSNHTNLAAQVDQPIAGLLKDLKQRGLLDDTLVVWGTEFGRSPGAQGDGRDHHPQGFCAFLAGGGIKGGVQHGATDELGFHAIEDRHYITDIHATALHQLGLDSRRLEIPGRKRLDMDHGEVIKDILA